MEVATNQYINSGEIAIIDDTTVEISELPVKTWTQVSFSHTHTHAHTHTHTSLHVHAHISNRDIIIMANTSPIEISVACQNARS